MKNRIEKIEYFGQLVDALHPEPEILEKELVKNAGKKMGMEVLETKRHDERYDSLRVDLSVPFIWIFGKTSVQYRFDHVDSKALVYKPDFFSHVICDGDAVKTSLELEAGLLEELGIGYRKIKTDYEIVAYHKEGCMEDDSDRYCLKDEALMYMSFRFCGGAKALGTSLDEFAKLMLEINKKNE